MGISQHKVSGFQERGEGEGRLREVKHGGEGGRTDVGREREGNALCMLLNFHADHSWLNSMTTTPASAYLH